MAGHVPRHFFVYTVRRIAVHIEASKADIKNLLGG